MQCKQQQNLERCPCTYSGCPRKGICCECVKHHRGNDELPACYFSAEAEASYDRSIVKYIQNRQGQ